MRKAGEARAATEVSAADRPLQRQGHRQCDGDRPREHRRADLVAQWTAQDATARIAMIRAIASVMMLSRRRDSSVVRRPGVQRGGLGGTRRAQVERAVGLHSAPGLQHDGGLEDVLGAASKPRLDYAGRVAVPRESDPLIRRRLARELAQQLAIALQAGRARVQAVHARKAPLPEPCRELRVAQQRGDASGNSGTSPGGGEIPQPRSTSGTPPTAVATTGRACDIASRIDIAGPLEMLVISTMSASRTTPWGSLVVPMNSKTRRRRVGARTLRRRARRSPGLWSDGSTRT